MHRYWELDLTAFENRKSSDFLETWQSIQWAIVEDNVLYVQHKGYSYQGYYDGKTAYITAISLEDYRILWTSSPLTAGGMIFEMIDNSIYCGFGKHIFVLDKFTGKRVQSISVKEGIGYLIAKEDTLYVYSEHYWDIYDILK